MASSDLETDLKPQTETAHLTGFRMPDFEDGGPDPEAPQPLGEDGEPIAAEPDIMDRETFWMTFQLVFSLPGTVLTEFAPLAIEPKEIEAGRGCSDACYDLLRIWYPQALIPGSETIGLILKAAPFLVAKIMLVRLILASRKKRQDENAGGGGEFHSRRSDSDKTEPKQPPREGSGPLIPDFAPVQEA